jgi:RimJ/RimL family protein N-acetyltransferase
MFIRSERLFLRPGWPEDWSELLTAINDEGIVRNLTTAPWPYTMDHAMAFAQRLQERMLPHFFITLPGSDGARLIGSIGLARRDDDVELGYWIARKHWGQGYATEAARAVLKLAEALGHRQITAGHFVDNPASGRVLAKAGFTRAGVPGSRFSQARGREVSSIPYAVQLDAVLEQANENYMRAA